MKNKYKILLVISVIALLVGITSFTFAYLRGTKVQSGTNVISAVSCLNVSIVKESNAINLKDAFPITDETALKSKNPYKFTVRNMCPNFIEAEVNLESLAVSNQLDKKYIKVYIKSEDMAEPTISILDSLEDRTPILENATSDSLTSVNIEPYGEKDFELRLWLDNNTTNEQGMGKYYEGKVVINTVPQPEGILVYGVRRDINSESSAWERIGASANFVANAQIGETPVVNDFDSVYPWSHIETYSYNTSTGEEISLSEVGVNNFPFIGTHGQVLTRIPEFYYKRYQQLEEGDKTYEYIFISPENLEGFTKSEQFSVGRYTMNNSSDGIYSKSGVLPVVNLVITDFRTNANSLGSEFGQLDYRYFILQLLYLVEYADYNSQSKLGLGHTSTLSSGTRISSGGCDSLGMKSGTLINDGKHSMIYRGIEDIYGNVFQYIDGINISNYIAYICTDPSQYKAISYTGCYEKIGYANFNISGKYISKLGYDPNHPLISLPIASDGSDSTYVTDRYNISEENNIAYVGGRWDSGLDAGLWYWALNNNQSTYLNYGIGGRLLRFN